MSRLHRYSRSPSPYRSSEYSSRRNIDKRYNKSDSRDRDHKYDRTRDRDQSVEDYKRSRSKSKKFSKRSSNRHHYHSERRSTTSSKPSTSSDYKSKKSKQRKRSDSQDETRNRNYEEKHNKSSSSSSSSRSTESSASSSSENSSSDSTRSDRIIPRRNSINVALDGDDVVCLDSQSPQATNVQYHSLDFMDVPTKTEIFDEINNDEFSQKMFSSKSTLNNKVLIDLTSDTISVPKVESKKEEDSIFHTNLYGRDSTRLQKWIKKLFTYRQKTLCGGNT